MPAAELLKAAIVYGDEVLLHSPTALLLASVAAISNLAPGDLMAFLQEIAPALGTVGDGFANQLQQLESTMGPDATQAIVQLLLDPTSGLRELVSTFDPAVAAELDQHTRQFEDVRRDLDRAVEEQLSNAGVAAVQPAIDAGLLQLVPLQNTDDLFDGYIEALWAGLRDPRCYPLFDERIAELVDAAVREGVLTPSPQMRSRGRQAGAASGFLARLPTFPRASMDEVVDIRAELERPLVRFRGEMVTVARDLGVDAFDPTFDEAAQEAWTSRVCPALLELEELVDEKHLRAQFGAKLPGSGVIGAAGGLVTGLITHAPLAGGGVAAGAAAVAAAAAVFGDRAKLERELRKRPYYLLHRTEELLASGERPG